MKKIFVATQNKHKLLELRDILNPMGFEIVSYNDFDIPVEDIEETGKTFEENAIIKAKSGCEFSKMPTIADDSGLCVDALNGAPGVYSARFSGENATSKSNNDLLLKKLDGVEDEKRTAKFVSVIACVFPDGREFTVRGECLGKIGYKEMGENGFGYDPLFISEYGMFGELSAEQKNAVSHRAKSLEKFKNEIIKYL